MKSRKPKSWWRTSDELLVSISFSVIIISWFRIACQREKGSLRRRSHRTQSRWIWKSSWRLRYVFLVDIFFWNYYFLGKTISHLIISLKTCKGSKQLKLDPTIYDSILKQRIEIGDVVYIEANTGAVKVCIFNRYIFIFIFLLSLLLSIFFSELVVVTSMLLNSIWKLTSLFPFLKATFTKPKKLFR